MSRKNIAIIILLNCMTWPFFDEIILSKTSKKWLEFIDIKLIELRKNHRIFQTHTYDTLFFIVEIRHWR